MKEKEKKSKAAAGAASQPSKSRKEPKTKADQMKEKIKDRLRSLYREEVKKIEDEIFQERKIGEGSDPEEKEEGRRGGGRPKDAEAMQEEIP